MVAVDGHDAQCADRAETAGVAETDGLRAVMWADGFAVGKFRVQPFLRSGQTGPPAPDPGLKPRAGLSETSVKSCNKLLPLIVSVHLR
jgi:hypothetical protein